MSEKVENASQKPKIFYGMHFCDGVAEYRHPGSEPHRVYLNEDTIRKMNPTFAGCPVYVKHVDDVVLSELNKGKEDGWVVESFYNAADGKTWVKFIVLSDKGRESISKGWRLSNAYIKKQSRSGGVWNGVDYQEEITDAEYEHLAIVDNPRYDESIILDAEQFRQYNADKEKNLKRFANSKDETKGESTMKFFKRAKVENDLDIENTLVILPESKKEMSIAQLVSEMDKIQNMQGYANGDHMVKVGDGEMSVNEMSKKYCKMNAEMEEMKKSKEENSEEEEKEGEEDKKKKNKKKNELTDEEKEAAKAHFESIKNAESQAPEINAPAISLDSLAKGKAKYGSN